MLPSLAVDNDYPISNAPEQAKFQQTNSYGMFNSKDTKDNIE